MRFVGATDETDNPFSSFKFDGVLGLAMPQMSQGPEFSLMDKLISTDALEQSLFSVFLSDSDMESSEITFGNVKKEHMASEMFWQPVSRQTGYWQVQVEDITINNKVQQLCTDCQVAVDTGTSQLAGPRLVGNLCTNMRFVGATDETDNPFSSFKFDGVLGLAMPQMSQGPEFSLMDKLISTDALEQSLFSVFLSDSDMESSEITFGNVKKEHMASEMFWQPVSRQTGYWQVQVEDITINNKAQQLCTDCQVAVDTGTSQLAGPTHVINELSNRLNVKQDCSNFHDLPNLGFVVGGNIMNLKPQDYVDKGSDGCEVSLMPLDVPPPNGPLFIFGDPFLRKYYTAYDRSENRVGFSVASHADMGEQEASALLLSLNGAGVVDRG
eukprot:CAMPEP_0172778412 /NCGR_PEP_ID=MMETSP1074-20121228/201894_1 /TAXON_ID=2916 /ORGANISM="Ceratium fusus, Strain PA161109" /LENGTH=382 /DNA_ID=CAMNT_0013615345 /DNA_START=19 /DNA_END=1164 /DNA_ORIENTATION=-